MTPPLVIASLAVDLTAAIFLALLIAVSLYGVCFGLRLARKERKRTRRIKRGHCPECGYDLQHFATRSCPECGFLVRFRRRPRTTHCRNCTYDLRGITSSRCPECGYYTQ